MNNILIYSQSHGAMVALRSGYPLKWDVVATNPSMHFWILQTYVHISNIRSEVRENVDEIFTFRIK